MSFIIRSWGDVELFGPWQSIKGLIQWLGRKYVPRQFNRLYLVDRNFIEPLDYFVF